MKLFCIIWTVAFLLAIIPAMQFDYRRKVMREGAAALIEFINDSHVYFAKLSIALKQIELSTLGAAEEMKKFQDVLRNKGD